MRTADAGPPPMSASPAPSRWIEPPPGPPITRISARPVGSGFTQPSGLPRLMTEPSLIGESARVSCGEIRWKFTNRGIDCGMVGAVVSREDWSSRVPAGPVPG
jgi:hypothetical protein